MEQDGGGEERRRRWAVGRSPALGLTAGPRPLQPSRRSPTAARASRTTIARRLMVAPSLPYSRAGGGRHTRSGRREGTGRTCGAKEGLIEGDWRQKQLYAPWSSIPLTGRPCVTQV